MSHLSEQEGDHVGGLPVGRMEEVREGHRGEGRQGVGAVQGVVYPLTAPPAGGDWARRRRRRKRQRSDGCGGRRPQQTPTEALNPEG